ncbi:hypothetical protein DLR60_12195 [Vibrio tarriae]|uniref:Uncharacterized protein n=1 Tax=Vibrio tarriae TaxID=2014742 RepID=A0AAU8WR27_9VIBR|nr:hypothetical protein [Vibrio tarriae]QEO46900.1 hypothetical protein F0315_16975 [Vibrio cholerae]ASK54276.1 hypothetical protein CEQ48_04750 [Vibrio tarriae]RBM25486.1 hypothetical protein DLR59_14365 [Vibrio tarriae]RBM32798.1 hypothetical protein DLR61_00650 [Vibrio tarriae]RBM35752.1 hypothetical protein DLR58_05195 [Vibrio tarriae]
MTLSASNQIGGKDTVTRSKLQAICFNTLLFEGFFGKRKRIDEEKGVQAQAIKSGAKMGM